MISLRNFSHLSVVWAHAQRALAVLAVLMIVFSPFVGHHDGHAASIDAATAIVIDHHSSPDGDADANNDGCCHPAAGCAAMVLSKTPKLAERFVVAARLFLRSSQLWEGHPAVPNLRPPIL